VIELHKKHPPKNNIPSQAAFYFKQYEPKRGLSTLI